MHSSSKMSDRGVIVYVELNVAKATNEYNAALANVQRANSDILFAIQDLSKVAATINQLAQVVDVLGKLAAAAA